jgi:ribosome-binding factor A
MTSRRVQKVSEAIREVIAMAILADLKDPRVQNVTVTFVEVTGDLRQAKVHVSVMGDETQQRLSLAGLKSAAGFLQSKVGDRVDTRYTPRLEFVLDMGVKKSLEIARILKQVLPPGDQAAEGAVPDAANDTADADAAHDDADSDADDEFEDEDDDEDFLAEDGATGDDEDAASGSSGARP